MIRRFLPILLAGALAAGAPVRAQTPATGVTPFDLRCDNATDPLGIDSTPPRLSWKLRTASPDSRAERQVAWQVLAATSRTALDADRGDTWDSGRMENDAQLQVPYNGRALRSGEEVFWKVRVWTMAAGQSEPHLSAWSEPAKWTMGVLAPVDWNSARWISDPELLRWVRPAFGFRSQDSADENAVKWVQIDLGAVHPIDAVRLHPLRHSVPPGFGVPRRFRIEADDRPDFRHATTISDHTTRDFRPGHDRLPDALVDGLGVPRANPRANGTLLLRREFSVRPGLRRALAFVSGLGAYELTLNGARAGDLLLTPGWTAYEKTCLYDTLDITSLLHPGANAAGLCLGNGMYNVREGRYAKFVSPFRPLTAIAQLRLEYDDGSCDAIVTDPGWRVAPGPITFSHIYGGEDYDARREPAGWNEPGFDDSHWTAAATHAGPGGALRGFSEASPSFRTFETLTPVNTRELRSGVTVYDLGQNASIMLRLRVRGPAGARVKITPAELLKSDGSIDRTSSAHDGAEASWNYTLAGVPPAARAEVGGDGETWTPKFFYHGCRYLQVERFAPTGGALPAVESVVGVVAHSDSPPAGAFACSNELFNRIHTLIRWAQRSNLAHVITDCPHRERLGWLAQSHSNGPSLRYEFDLTRLYTKALNDIADAQQPNGLVPDIAPEFVVFDAGFRDSPEWGSAIVLLPWQHYVWTGDDAPLRRNYEAMCRYFNYLTSRANNGIVSYGLGDWFDIGPRRPGASQLTPVGLTGTAFYHEDALLLSRIAAHLGRVDEARLWTVEAARIADAFNAKFLDSAAGVYATGSQTAQALPLMFDLVPPGQRANIVDALVRDIRARDDAFTTGNVGYRSVLHALGNHGRSDVVFDMNVRSDRPGYANQLARGATSLTEAWNADPRASQNHFMLGQLVEWFYANLAGLAPDADAPGFKRVLVHPQPVGDITWANASYESPRGHIAVAWTRHNGRFALEVEIPSNATAEVRMPYGNRSAIVINGAPAEKNGDAHLLRMDDGQPVYAIGSGRYVFSAPMGASEFAGPDGRATSRRVR